MRHTFPCAILAALISHHVPRCLCCSHSSKAEAIATLHEAGIEGTTGSEFAQQHNSQRLRGSNGSWRRAPLGY
jgi:hypothetical protein